MSLGLGIVACGSPAPKAAEVDPRTFHETAIELEKCPVDEAGSEKLDANGDGRAEVVIVSKGGRPFCRVIDLNLDGRPDRTVFLADDGTTRRVESDYDRDGRVDEIALYKGGVLDQRHRATTLDGKLNTWEYYEGGKIVRTERDENGDGYVDQWWEYPRPECPLIHSDIDADGHPDPSTTIDYCKATGYVPPPPQEAKASTAPSFEATGPQGEPVRELSNVSESEAAKAEAERSAGEKSGANKSDDSTKKEKAE